MALIESDHGLITSIGAMATVKNIITHTLITMNVEGAISITTGTKIQIASKAQTLET